MSTTPNNKLKTENLNDEVIVRGEMDRYTSEAVIVLKHSMTNAIKRNLEILKKSGLIQATSKKR